MRLKDPLPLPPLEMRQLVGPTDPELFDLGDRRVALPEVPVEQFRSVFDFGCGCGRVARMLIQQDSQPERYVGIDLHRGMIEWCNMHLAPRAPGFEFHHCDIWELGFNPGGTADWLPFPVEDHSFSLVNATSVFTHVLEDHALRYLHEVARVLGDDGLLHSTWFLFDKREFPMMQPFQNVLFVNPINPINATIFDRDWLRRAAADAGLTITNVALPAFRGFQWTIQMSPVPSGRTPVELPIDDGPYGEWQAPALSRPPHEIGSEPGPP